MTKYKNLVRAILHPLFLSSSTKRNFPILNISEMFMSNVTDKNFLLINTPKIIKIFINKLPFKYYKVKNTVFNYKRTATLFDKSLSCKKSCIYFCKNKYTLDVVYCIPFPNGWDGEFKSVLYGDIEYLKNLSYLPDSPIKIKDTDYKIFIELERILLEDIDKLELIKFLGKFFYEPKPSENIYIISTEENRLVHKYEILEVMLDYDKIMEIYKYHPNKSRIILDNIYKIRFCDLYYGSEHYIITKVYYIDYESVNSAIIRNLIS